MSLLVIYRLCGIESTNPSPWLDGSKYDLNKLCLKSFVAAFAEVKPKIHFLLDFCGEEYRKMIDRVCPFKKTLEFTKIGINETMLRAYEIAADSDDYVLMQECDYLYRPNVGRIFTEALKKLDIVSPYDHLNFYIDKNLHSDTCEVKLVKNYHFRSTERNTMTWATHSDLIRRFYAYFLKYGYLDDLIWRDLGSEGKKLWVPVPSFATHCVKDFLAPSVNWEKYYEQFK